MDILRILVVSYLVATLAATGLAKLVNRETASAGMTREGVLRASIALPAILTVAITELSLAMLLALGTYPVITAFGAAGLFILFAGYRIIVAVKVNAIVCSCAGAIRTDPATPAAVAGSVLACMCLAGLACIAPLLGQPTGYPLTLITIFSLILPIATTLVGLRAGKRSGPDTRFPSNYVALGTEDMYLKSS